MRKIVLVTMFVLFATSLMADIVFSGDARVRPRYDKIDTMDADGEIIKTTINTYWLYRARPNVNATIGEGYFFKGQIGHNAGAQWSKMGDATELPTGISNGSAQAPSLSWMLLNFGAKKDNYGWAIGRIGVPGHSLTDMHYYSSAMLDVPFVVNNNAAVTGGNIWINIGPGKLKGYLGNNVNNLNSLEDFVND
ncbi:MAG: hypothetical protein KAI81_08755, partial [Candidatus Marinimicrobia bacterium]|nr:hypothetical protein [Candidatus Neomarinimicrobiota bacterium]